MKYELYAKDQQSRLDARQAEIQQRDGLADLTATMALLETLIEDAANETPRDRKFIADCAKVLVTVQKQSFCSTPSVIN